MLPVFVVVAGLAVGLLYDPDWATPFYDPRASILAIPALLIVQLAFGRLLAATAAVRRPGASWDDFARRLIRSANAYRGLATALYACAVWNFHWPRVVQEVFGIGRVPLLGLLATLAPLVLLLVASFFGLHRAESAARGDRPPLRDYLAFQARQGLLLPLAPALAVITVFETVDAVPALRTAFLVYPFLSWLLLAACAVAMVAFAPALLSLLWAAQPFPDGPLKDRLHALCDQAGVRRPRLAVWPTRGFGHVNAAVVGLHSRTRTVLFTDALLASFTPDEVAAVLAHELGHARHRHLVFYFTLAMGAAFFVTASDWALRDAVPEAGRLALALAVAATLAAGAFGFFSRRFERQADLFAARLVPAPVYIGALEKVAALSGNLRKVWFFTHMSIEMRVNFLLEAGLRPDAAARFERRLSRAVVAGFVFSAFSLGSAAVAAAGQVREAPLRRAELDAMRIQARAEEAWDAGRREEALRLADEAARADARWMYFAAELRFDAERPAEALARYKAARKEFPPGTEDRVRIEQRIRLLEGVEERSRRK